jgi:transglycosylase-like protein with SLT domain
MASLNTSQRQMAILIYNTFYNALRNAGFSTQAAANRAIEAVAAAYMESGLNPNARNASSGAAGLFQLLSSGYVNAANSMGGVYNPLANIKAILPAYLSYWKSHPSAVAGAGARDVERSGQSASWYAQPLGWIAPYTKGTYTGSYSTSAPSGGSFGVDTSGTSTAGLEAILRGFGLNPSQFSSIIDQAIRNNWSIDEFTAMVYQSKSFHAAFPGIFRSDGSLKMSPLEYRQVADSYRKIAGYYGIKMSTERVGLLFANNKSPDEFADEALVYKSVVLGEDLGLRNSFNQVLRANGVKPMEIKDWYTFLLRKPHGYLLDLYEAASLKDAGLMLPGKTALETARQVGEAGVLTDLPKLVQQIRQVKDFVTPELTAAGITDADLAILESGKDPRSQATLLQSILASRQALAGVGTRVGAFPAPVGQGATYAPRQEGL